MPSGAQIRGMLLEEIILKALETAGYDTLLDADGTLVRAGGAGLEVHGRGTHHQIDAIADYSFQQPFSHPQRLLVEGKCYAENVGLGVIQNAVGVLKDVAEFWNFVHFGQQRFHYQYAVFSASNFSPQAQEYAFAQDIYLFPLSNSKFFRPILRAIGQAKTRRLEARMRKSGVSMSDMRRALRRALREPHSGRTELHNFLTRLRAEGAFDPVLDAVSRLQGVLFASTMSGFLVLLVPNPNGPQLRELIIEAMEAPIKIRVQRTRRTRTWFIESAKGKRLFTLDIPPELFRLYTGGRSLDREARNNLKAQEFAYFQAPYRIGNEIAIARFKLDPEWVSAVEQSLPSESP